MTSLKNIKPLLKNKFHYLLKIKIFLKKKINKMPTSINKYKNSQKNIKHKSQNMKEKSKLM